MCVFPGWGFRKIKFQRPITNVRSRFERRHAPDELLVHAFLQKTVENYARDSFRNYVNAMWHVSSYVYRPMNRDIITLYWRHEVPFESLSATYRCFRSLSRVAYIENNKPVLWTDTLFSATCFLLVSRLASSFRRHIQLDISKRKAG